MPNTIFTDIQVAITLIYLENDVKTNFLQSQMDYLIEEGINGKIAFLENHNDVFFKHCYYPLLDIAFNIGFMPNTDYFTDELKKIFKQLMVVSSVANESNKRLNNTFYPTYTHSYINELIIQQHDYQPLEDDKFPAEIAKQIINSMIG